MFSTSTANDRLPVSVIIPCYRSAGTIGRALDSIACQSALPAEVIVVDDASGDDLQAQVTRALSWARIFWLDTNRGPGAARNAGWAMATQPFLAFLDADDAWHPRKLELQHGWMDAHPDVVLTGHRVVDLEPPDTVTTLEGEPVSAGKLMLSNRFQTSSVMLLRKIPERFVAGKRYCEDFLLWLEIVLRGGQAFFLDAALARRFKPVYGAGGLSGRLWRMQQGEIDALSRVRSARLVGAGAYLGAAAWSWLKFARRVATTAFVR